MDVFRGSDQQGGILGFVVGDGSHFSSVHVGVERGNDGIVQGEFDVDEMGDLCLEGEETVGVYLKNKLILVF